MISSCRCWSFVSSRLRLQFRDDNTAPALTAASAATSSVFSNSNASNPAPIASQSGSSSPSSTCAEIASQSSSSSPSITRRRRSSSSTLVVTAGSGESSRESGGRVGWDWGIRQGRRDDEPVRERNGGGSRAAERAGSNEGRPAADRERAGAGRRRGRSELGIGNRTSAHIQRSPL